MRITLNTRLKTFLVKLIEFYQKHISPHNITGCIFFPSCSVYTKEAIIKYGIIKGIYLGVRRILRCHPWQHNRIDPLK